MKLSIVIPVYNSSKVIISSLNRLKDALNKTNINYEILVRDDKSTDNSASILKNINEKRIRVFFNEVNRGLGYTLRKLFSDAKGDAIVYLDMDMSFDINAIPNFINELKHADVIVASKYKGIKGKLPFSRIVASRIYYMINHILFNISVKDVGSGLIMIKKKCIKDLGLKSDGFRIHVELFHKLIKKNYIVRELPVAYSHNDAAGSFKLLKHGPKTLLETIKYWREIQ